MENQTGSQQWLELLDTLAPLSPTWSCKVNLQSCYPAFLHSILHPNFQCIIVPVINEGQKVFVSDLVDSLILMFVHLGEIQRPGVLRPVTREIYRPALKRLADFGIVATKTVTTI